MQNMQQCLRYIDSKLYKTAWATFRAMYPENFKKQLIPLCKLSNRPQRHKGLKVRTFAIKHKGMNKGRCKICGCNLKAENRHCHRVMPSLSINRINKVPNLVWICYNCDKSIHGEEISESFDKKKTGRINKYREKLIM